MAESKANRSERGSEGGQAIARRDDERREVHRREPSAGPFARSFDFVDRMTDEMERVFERMSRDFGLPGRSWMPSRLFGSRSRQGLWSPRIEAFQKGDRFIVRAELPGLKKEDVQVELTEDVLTIHGERQAAHEEEREGYYHSEREYGQFYRTIPLPQGVIGESARASFSNGVLEISMQAPPEASRRRLEIQE